MECCKQQGQIRPKKEQRILFQDISKEASDLLLSLSLTLGQMNCLTSGVGSCNYDKFALYHCKLIVS